MSRVTKKYLQDRMARVNLSLGRPDRAMAAQPDGSWTNSQCVGHISLDHSHTGYQLEEITNVAGAVYAMTGRMTASEANAYINGMLAAMSLARKE